MIFGRKRDAAPEPEEEEQVEHVTFQGPINGVQPNLGANARLVQAALIPLKDMVTDALLRRAEQIRIDPKGPAMLVRIFVDGIGYPSAKMSRQQGSAIVQMAKLLAGLDIKLLSQPQIGVLKAEHDEQPYEITVQSAPVAAEKAERVSIRIENVKKRPEKPMELGINESVRNKIREMAERKGVLLICGAPGSGVTYTTFGVLRSIDPYTQTVLTLGETFGRKLIAMNPFEWSKADGLQTGLFRALKSEPDVLYVDPIRDAESAKTIFKFVDEVTVIAEFTAKDVVTGVGQLLQWTGDKELVANGLRGLVSVKLIRKLCSKCKQVFRPNPKMLDKLGLPPETSMMYRPPRPPEPGTPEAESYSPCEVCGGLGYLGRVGIFELLEVTPGMKKVLSESPTPNSIRQQMKNDETPTFQKEALRLVGEGITSMEEVQRAFQQPGG